MESGKPDFPFCLCWANHSWYKKVWNPDVPDKLLIEQTYPGVLDYIDHFNAMLPAFKDPRYMKVNGKLIFGVFSPLDVPDFDVFKSTWNRLAQENGLEGFCFFAFSDGMKKGEKALSKGYDMACVDYIQWLNTITNPIKYWFWKIIRKFTSLPLYLSYAGYSKTLLKYFVPTKGFVPCIVPGFDHSPRSKNRGVVLLGSTPEKWRKLCSEIFNKVKFRNKEENIVFIKAWNEWGEGNYMEPDLKFGKGYINALRSVNNL